MTSDVEKKLLEAILRHDLMAFGERAFRTLNPAIDFLPTWHLKALAHALSERAAGRVRRLIITLPPRSMKSIMASVAFPAWLVGHQPTRRIICASYSADLALKLARDCRNVMDAEWYKSTFTKTRLNRRRTDVMDYSTTMRGFRFSTSVNGTLTGRGKSKLAKRSVAIILPFLTIPSAIDNGNLS